MRPASAVSMPSVYDGIYETLLAASAGGSREPDALVTAFWPFVGWKYDGSIMVIGRSVNGWIDQGPIGGLADIEMRHSVVKGMREDAEREDRCPMLWVTDLAGRTSHHYNTNRSAFWRVLRDITLRLSDADRADWPSSLAWTNLYKLAPAAGWNPGADLQRAQRLAAIDLFAAEIEAMQPRRILALTGRWWFEPFRAPLAFDIEWHEGLVEGIGTKGSAKVVVARHPMTKSHNQFVAEILAAFEEKTS